MGKIPVWVAVLLSVSGIVMYLLADRNAELSASKQREVILELVPADDYSDDYLTKVLPNGTFVLDGAYWVTVKNPDGIRNGNGFFPFNDNCVIRSPGHLTSVAAMPERDEEGRTQSLVRHSTAGNPSGTFCPSETLFVITDESFEILEKEFIGSHQTVKQEQADNAAEREAEEREKKLIRSILEGLRSSAP